MSDTPFVKHHYGPYADKLRHALNNMEGHFIRGVGDGVVDAEIEPIGEALNEADKFILDHENSALSERVARVRRLIEGFQSSYGMELLASVHWVATREQGVASAKEATVAVQNWNRRKQSLMTQGHVEAAWSRLEAEGWLSGQESTHPNHSSYYRSDATERRAP